MIPNAYFLLLKNYISDFVDVKLGRDPLKPLIFVFYTNLLCNFNCSYCNYAKSGATREKDGQLNTEKTFRILEIIRKSCPIIYFTGGEPLLRNDIVDILKKSKELKFKSITLNTNMGLTHKKLEALDYVTNFVASFDSVSDKKNSESWGVSEDIARQVKKNIVQCAKLQKEKGFVMAINCVVTKDGIGDAYRVLDFCLKNKIKFSIVPAGVMNGAVDKALVGNQEYQKLVKHVRKTKDKTKLILGSNAYLNTILDFKPFKCFPTLTPSVYPNGDVFYPCEILSKATSNLLKTNSYEKALEEGIRKYGKLPMCKKKCYKLCAINPSSFVRNPFSVAKETWDHL